MSWGVSPPLKKPILQDAGLPLLPAVQGDNSLVSTVRFLYYSCGPPMSLLS